MTVRDIFELRKQGKIEEAYEAIRPMYAAHKGKYTSICMFWTASDIFKLRLEQGRTDEAALIFQALKHVLPYINDKDGKSMAFMQYAARRMAKVTQRTYKEPSLQDGKICAIRDVCVTKEKEADICEPKESSPDDISAISAIFAGQKETRIEEDFSGRLIVGLDEGIIDRPYDQISTPQTKVLEFIKSNEGCSVPKITAATGIPAKSVERHIAALIAKSLIEHRGSKKTGGYYKL